MKRKLTALIAYSMFWLLFFVFARFFFIITHHKEAFQFGIGTLAATFTHGFKLDVSATSYILIFPLLASIPAIWIRGNWYQYFVKWYTWLILLLSSAIIVADTVLYTYWGFRMDYTPFLYLNTPQEAAASVTTFQIILVSFTVIFITVLFGILYNKFWARHFEEKERVIYKLPVTLLLLILCGALIIPIRGGLGVAPINAGTAYFSEHMFINHAAINVTWNVGSSAINHKPVRNPYVYSDLDLARSLTDSLTSKKGEPEKVLNNSRPNILMIILESFGNSLIGPLGGDSLTTPCLNRYIKEGLVFSNFYASGYRTDKALPAILSGYPAQPATSIIKEPKKSQSLPSIVRILNRSNYKSSFWYGGDINFANFNSFIISSGFRNIITMENFDPADYNSKWGVHDNVLFKALQDSMKQMKQPFFRVVLTLSSHEPFEVPMEPVFKGNDNLTKFRNSVYYTDKTVGTFLDWAKQTDWWKNTLVILVADHCRRNALTDLVYSKGIFKIPMIWLGGALKEPGTRMEKLGDQVDIPLTLLHQMGLEGDFPFGKDLLYKGSDSFAFYTFNEGFAFITDSSTVIYDQKLGRAVVREGIMPEIAEKYGKAYLQVLYDDYLKK
jgi:phosphoglycerol transferase MdoB-like AlkP superfamily enzyme